MSDNNELYEPDLISVTDDDGNEIVCWSGTRRTTMCMWPSPNTTMRRKKS